MLDNRVASSLAGILGAAKSIRSEWTPNRTEPEELWFRGTSNRAYPLLPRLYRASCAGADEESFFEYFRSYARSLVSVVPDDEWGWYFLAQHHGLPTRLLDWSKDLLVAVFFALSSHCRTMNAVKLGHLLMNPNARRRGRGTHPAIWMMDAGTLNQLSTRPRFDGVILPGRPWSAPYAPSRFFKTAAVPSSKRGRFPIALFPAQDNPRIIPQHGVFTLHGRDRGAIEALAAAHPRLRLARIDLTPAHLEEMWDELILAGIHEHELFPTLDKVADYVLRNYLPDTGESGGMEEGDKMAGKKGPGKGGGGGKKKGGKKKAAKKKK